MQTPKSSATGIKISLANLHRADLAKTNLTSILTQGTNLKKQKFFQKATKLSRLAQKKIEPWVEWTHQTGYLGQVEWRESLHYEPH